MIVCSGVELRLRELSRQFSVSELSRGQLSSDLEALRLQLQDGQKWETEKQVCINGHVQYTNVHVHVPAWCTSLVPRHVHVHCTLYIQYMYIYIHVHRRYIYMNTC